jgi:hypothetical protein
VIDAWQEFNTMQIAIGFALRPSYGNKLLRVLWNLQFFSKISIIILFPILKFLGNCFNQEFYGILSVNVVNMILNKSNFILGKILLVSWQMIVKARMETWKNIRQHSRSLKKILHLETKKTIIWTTINIFSSFQGSMKRNLTPPMGFLPQVLATFNIQPIQFFRCSASLDIEEKNIVIGEETLETAIDALLLHVI